MFGGLIMVTYLLATQENEDSNEVKYENYESYIDDMSEKGHLIWGAGVGSEFYAKGRGYKLSYSELSYLDILRMYGIPVGLYLIYLFFAPYFGLWKYQNRSIFLKRFCLGYVLFLILSGTNPLLLGSIGLTALSMFMVIVNKAGDMGEGEEDGLIVDHCLLR